ncbi:unnamed protein product [Arabidopsis thaliana]|uniref:DNA2/NAM7 helicase helicase domain-containing protein n=1 Tax=Arabidopsis thaliana TaxID=3702 RepID=A0A654G6H8_ARATH|nr:unnamed protein product [Arabidopsis thaliana]
MSLTHSNLERFAQRSCQFHSNPECASRKFFAKLNSSQEAAILGFLKTRNCKHKKSVKLIWGPPGTGKTKTVATLLSTLIQLKCKTVVCAPTNTAIVAVASRLLSLSKETIVCAPTNSAIAEVVSRFEFSTLFYGTSILERTTYGMGNIVLSGNRERMGITNNKVLLNVFFNDRVSKLGRLFLSTCGWKKRLESIIDFLENTEAKYEQHVNELELERMTEDEKKKEEVEERTMQEVVNIPTFGEFVKKKLYVLTEELGKDMADLSTHLPKSFISAKDVKNMIAARQALHRVRYFLQENSSRDYLH